MVCSSPRADTAAAARSDELRHIGIEARPSRVDAADWTALDWAWARDRLERVRNYWLVTVSAGGRPRSLPVWGVWNDDVSNFCFSCAPTAREVHNLVANPAVVITTEDTIECVSLEGTAALVTTDHEREAWIEQYVDKYRAMGSDVDAPFLRRDLLVSVEPSRAFGIIEREAEFAARATKWVFEPSG